uniref:Uncharacterized protein n=1 Tax=Anguilla anguilla TaxID=7936 RepID=A0A0E9RYP2_ANGAN
MRRVNSVFVLVLCLSLLQIPISKNIA